MSRVPLFSDLESFRVDFGVDPESIEGGLFDGVGPDGPAQPKGELHSVDVTVVGEVEPVLRWRRARGTSAG